MTLPTESAMRQQVYARTCVDCAKGRPKIGVNHHLENDAFAGQWPCTANVALADLVIGWVREAQVDEVNILLGNCPLLARGYYDGEGHFVAHVVADKVSAAELQAAAKEPYKRPSLTNDPHDEGVQVNLDEDAQEPSR
jgi:hypothetical protein